MGEASSQIPQMPGQLYPAREKSSPKHELNGLTIHPQGEGHWFAMRPARGERPMGTWPWDALMTWENNSILQEPRAHPLAAWPRRAQAAASLPTWPLNWQAEICHLVTSHAVRPRLHAAPDPPETKSRWRLCWAQRGGAPREHWKLMWGRTPATTRHPRVVTDHLKQGEGLLVYLEKGKARRPEVHPLTCDCVSPTHILAMQAVLLFIETPHSGHDSNSEWPWICAAYLYKKCSLGGGWQVSD